MAFRAEDDDEARAMIDDQEGGIRSDLKALVGADGKPLWDGKSAIQAKEATVATHRPGRSRGGHLVARAERVCELLETER